jgi:hypothetical protein
MFKFRICFFIDIKLKFPSFSEAYFERYNIEKDPTTQPSGKTSGTSQGDCQPKVSRHAERIKKEQRK